MSDDDFVLDRIPAFEWDVHVWDHSGPRPGRLDVADRKRLVSLVRRLLREDTE